MATEGTKFQVNYKLADGTLINLYAGTVQELETGLTDLSMVPPASLKKYKIVLAGKFTGFKYNKIETEQIDD